MIVGSGILVSARTFKKAGRIRPEERVPIKARRERPRGTCLISGLLKLKEIAYVHAEGMPAGELKHGTLALIEEGTPVISLINNSDSDMVSNTKEVEARGAMAIPITNNSTLWKRPNAIAVRTDNDGKFGILAAVAGQLIAYYVADKLGRPIDKPRNLAKSVTVK